MNKYTRIDPLRICGVVALSAGLLAPAVPVLAQQEGAAGVFLEEIVTTARKRSTAEAVQEVPVAVNAFGADQIEALFVKKLEDMSYLMPNVQLESVGTFPGVQNFSIRGQGINSSIPSVDPTVGVFVDGVYMGTTYGVVIDTFDLESVEVLRGPQGLLFGRNVTGGAVVLRNARPTGEFGFRARVGSTDESQMNIAMSIEGALSDNFAAKLALLYDDDSGYYSNLNPTATSPAPHPLQPFYANAADGSDVGALETLLVRPSFVWSPTDRSDWTLIYEHGETDGDGSAWSNVTAQRAGLVPEYATLSDETGFTEIEWNQLTLETNIAEVGNGTVTNVLGWREVNAESAADIDGTDLPIFAAPGNTEQSQISNELRWAGDLSDNWEATFGVYYFDQEVEYREARYIWLPPPIGPAPLGINLQAALGGDMDADNFGIFWSNDFHVRDDLTLTAGIRYTDESKSANIIIGGCADNANFNCTFDSLEGEWDNITPKLGALYHVNDDTRVYGFWSKGYRSGGFNFRNARPDVIPPGPTREEENNTFEVGLKTEFADGRARLNIAAFHNEVKDMQRELNIPDPLVIVLQATITAGDVTIKGFEADFVALLTDSFSVNLTYGWQDGEYDSLDPFVPAFEAALRNAGVLGPTELIIGPELPRLAPSNYSLGFSWDIPVGAGLVNVAANYSYREGHPYNDSNSELFDDQKRTNASINWFSGDDRWSASLYGKNLGDEANWGNLTSIAGLWTAGPMKKGRVLGLEINYRYQ
jgi:iron complex outermembrane receptor protein